MSATFFHPRGFEAVEGVEQVVRQVQARQLLVGGVLLTQCFQRQLTTLLLSLCQVSSILRPTVGLQPSNNVNNESHLIPEKSPIIPTISGDYISVTAPTDHVNIEKDPKNNTSKNNSNNDG